MSASEKREAYKAILMLGLVSLLGDIVYEGARGVIPEYLKFLGASALIVGAIIGLGELISYVSRLAGGVIADKTGGYWPLIFLGYGLIAALPLLPTASLAGGWVLAATLILLERLGKGLRTPARDTIISFISRHIGRGKAFGLHELLDQIGAVSGPLALAAILAFTGDYTPTLASLAIPYIALMATLYLVYRSIRGYVERQTPQRRRGGTVPEAATAYITAVVLNTIALLPAPLILYQAAVVFGPQLAWIVPVLYAAIQLIDAPTALAAGLVYDKIGLKILYIPFLLTVAVAPLTLIPTPWAVAAAAAFYGLVLGSREAVYRAAVADLTTPDKRATVYGVFNTAVGVGVLVAGILYGYMMDTHMGPPAGLAASLLLSAGAVALLYVAEKKARAQ